MTVCDRTFRAGLGCALLVCGLAKSGSVGTGTGRRPVAAARHPSLRATAPRQPDIPDFARVRVFITRAMDSAHVPSMAVAVARRGEVLWEEGFGLADRENRVPATQHTLYAIASVTKLMTGTALMVLHERGQLDFDRPVNDYLGSARVSSPVWNPATATVRRVAMHTGGLGTYADNCVVAAPRCQDEMISRYGVLIWRPGERFDYSNLGYGVLSEVVRHVSGEPYTAFMRDSVFKPLGMSHCSVDVEADLAPFTAVRYDAFIGRLAGPLHVAAEGASSVFCSVHDLVRFGMFHLGQHPSGQKAILGDSSIRALQMSTVAADGGERYGFGWWHETRFGYDLTDVGGGTSSEVAQLYTIPSDGIVVVVVANTPTPLASAVVDEIISTLLPAYGQARARALGQPVAPAVPPAPDSFPTIAGIWSGAIATHAGAVPLTLSISSAGIVRVTLGDHEVTTLKDAHYRDGQLDGQFVAKLGVDDAQRHRPYDLELQLFLRGHVLNGGVWPRFTPGPDDGGVNPYWVQLAKGTTAAGGDR